MNMTFDLRDYTFWIMAAIWFTVPIISWLWSVVTFPLYRRLTGLLNENVKVLGELNAIREKAESSNRESLELRTKVEGELKEVSAYYEKIQALLEQMGK